MRSPYILLLIIPSYTHIYVHTYLHIYIDTYILIHFPATMAKYAKITSLLCTKSPLCFSNSISNYVLPCTLLIRTCLPLTCDTLPFPFTHFALRFRSLRFLFIAQFTFTLNFHRLSWLSACAYALFQRLVIYCVRL